MAFKHDADSSHVQAFRAIVAKVKDLDEKIDVNLLTPDEAWAELGKFIEDTKFPEPPAHVKKAQAEAKKVADAEAKAQKDAEAAAKKTSEPEPVTARGGR